MPSRTVNRSEMEPYRQTPDEVLNAFDTSARSGLRREQAQERLKRYGRNELAAEAAGTRLAQVSRPVQGCPRRPAARCGADLGRTVALRARRPRCPTRPSPSSPSCCSTRSWATSRRRGRSRPWRRLRQMSAAHADVIRDGDRQSHPGGRARARRHHSHRGRRHVPADARLIQSTALQTAEAALTGESLPVAKDTAAIAGRGEPRRPAQHVFSGTAATYGRGRAVVTATGMQTQMGRIAGMLKAAPDEATPLQKELDRVGKLLGSSSSSSPW